MTDTAPPSAHAVPRVLVAAVIAFGALVAAALVLWVHYGTAVFMEMIIAGIAACF